MRNGLLFLVTKSAMSFMTAVTVTVSLVENQNNHAQSLSEIQM